MSNIPMDIDVEFFWNKRGEKVVRRCEYLYPLRKRKLERSKDDLLDCTGLVKYIPKDEEPSKRSVKVRSPVYRPKLKDIPFMLLTVLYFLFDTTFLCICIYAFLQLFLFIQKDLMHKIRERRIEIQQMIEEAVHNYQINKCDPSTRVPAIEGMCNKWECIIKNGSSSIKYTRVCFEVIGDVIDGFVRKFSIRSSLVLGIFLIIFLKYRKSR